jgi:DMSO/TMAO reductase YedYZ molybdopterin-dependent catalytic subunit
MAIINSGFQRKRPKDDRLPKGQYLTEGFPVLSLGPTPKITPDEWSLEITGQVKNNLKWSYEEFNKLPKIDLKTDIHCLTKWSKFDTNWQGVSLDEIIKLVEIDSKVKFLIAHSSDGYTTNIPLKDTTRGQAMVAVSYDNKEIPSEHGGPVRLLVPHLYFWKSAKWLTKLEFSDTDQPGFWEIRGYHNYGDPWKEQRYSFDE